MSVILKAAAHVCGELELFVFPRKRAYDSGSMHTRDQGIVAISMSGVRRMHLYTRRRLQRCGDKPLKHDAAQR